MVNDILHRLEKADDIAHRAVIGSRICAVKGTIDVCKNGAGILFSEELAKQVLLEKEIEILVTAGDGPFKATAWGCDLTYDYVKINGDYRT